MKWFKAQYQWRGKGAGGWGHTVRLVEDPEHKLEKYYGVTIDPEEVEDVLIWAEENAGARRISYDTWQFKSAEEADQFIMVYNLRWT